MSKRVSTVLVGPTAWVREGIASILQNTPYKVEAVASEPAELAHVHYPVEKRTLAIIGANGNRRLDDAAACIRLLRSCMPGGKLVLIAEISEPIVDREWLSSADACIVNLRSREILMKVLELAFLGQRVLVFDKSIALTAKDHETAKDHDESSNVFRTDQPPINGHSVLSAREYEVLFYLAQGKSNKVIARLCNITESTIKVHLKSILRKTNTKNRTQAAIWAIERGVRNHSLEHGMMTDAPTLSPAMAPRTVE